jgi:alpha-galactosidase
MKKLIFIISLACCLNMSGQKFNNLALTPPMGWNSWNKFACDIDEKIIRETADAMVSSGLKDAGYEYLVIDDCWHGQRDSLGFIHPDPKRFPSGIKALSDYIHSKGLKFGIYSCAGNKTCGGHPGSRGHEYQDAITYAQWGVDYLKYDWCNTDELNAKEAYKTMRDALYAAKRPVVFSLCEWGNNKPWLWGAEIGHLWRTTGDITASWSGSISHGEVWNSWSILTIIDIQKDLRKYAGPGHWNDPDMLEVGNGMTTNEDRAHFSMWAMLAAPLIAGNDVRHMSKETTDILTNKEIIAVDQDPLGIQCFKFTTLEDANVDVYVKPLKNDELAVCFLNRSDNAVNIEFNWKKENIDDPISQKNFNFNKNVYLLRDIWTKTDLGNTNEIFKATLSGHNAIMLRLKKK